MAIASINNKKRVLVMLIIALLGFLVILIQLFCIQIVKGDYYQSLAYTQQTKDRLVKASRGTIYDAKGNALALSVSTNVLTISPTNISTDDKKQIAKDIAEILELEYDTVFNKINKSVSQVTIATNIDKDIAIELSEYISENELKGVYVDESTRRVYPYGAMLSHVLGFTGTDDQGLYGLEIGYEDSLAGIPGKIVGSIDAGGNETPYEQEEYVEPQEGYDLLLTIDASIQSIVEKNMEKATLENDADFGMCVVMRPDTGEILAMSTSPDFDPNSPFTINDDELLSKWDTYTTNEKSDYLNEMWRNKCISDAYEPGSTFKIFTAAAALEEGTAVLDKKEYNCIGYMTIMGWKISCWRYPNTHGTETLREGIINSCNPVLMQVAIKLGADKFCEYLKAFGLYSITGIDLPGEASGICYNSENMTDLDLATNGFGQNISITTLQLATIYSAVANGGYVVTPHVVKEIKASDGSVVKANTLKIKKQVLSKETANNLMSSLYDTVNTGTSKAAQATGYTIAGKTGTAEEGRGANGVYMASFAGIAPANDPEIVIIVSLYNPKSSQGHMGGIVAAPVAGNIIEETLRYLDIDPNYTETSQDDSEIVVPNLVNMTYSKAKETLKNLGFNISSDATLKNEDIVLDQIPKFGASLIKNSTIRVYTNEEEKSTAVVPDIRGYSKDRAISIIQNRGLNVHAIGSGEAILQDPSPGAVITKGSIVTVKFVDTTDLH